MLSVLPQAGVFSGGTVVTLLGQGFHGLGGNVDFASCRFLTSNSIADTAPIQLNPDFWTCRSPNQTGIAEGEAALVLVTLNAQQYVDTTYRFSYYTLIIDDVNVNGGPPGGVATGATVVTLRGFGCDRGPVRDCRFGLLTRVPVLSVSNDRQLCATPPADAGDVHLLLSNDNVVYIDTGLDYTYYVQPPSSRAPSRAAPSAAARSSHSTARASPPSPLLADLSDDDRRQAARCLWGGEFSSTLSTEGGFATRRAPRRSRRRMSMSGQAGVRAPDIATAALADPDNGDDVFGAGDTLTITFDAPTNKAGSGLLSEAGGKAYVDELFSFSHSLGARYHGRWRDASVFVVTMVDTGGHAIPASLGGATVAVVGDIKTSNELSRWCKAVTPLSGNTGTQAAPTIAAFDAQTWDLHDAGWSHHDTITIRFDRPTDRGGRQGGKGFVDTTISFSQPLGADYSGTWRDASTFVVTVLDASGAGDGPRVNGTSGALVSIASQLYNSPRTSSPSSSSYRMQSGDFGDAAASPSLRAFYVADSDNSNSSYDAGDEILVQFDRAAVRRCLEAATR